MPVLPRFEAEMQRIADARKLAKFLLETGDVPDGNGSMPRRRSADGANPTRLRGLPAIGRNVSGATVHTDPVKALLAKEARGEQRR